MIRHVTKLVVLLATVLGTATLGAQNPAAQKAVLITGASTGIGRTMTELFASKGYFVYAGGALEDQLDEME